MTYTGRHALVLGAARSGRAAAALLLSLGARVSAWDRDAQALGEMPEPVARLDAQPADFDAFDLVVASPGFPMQPHPKLVPEVDLAAAHVVAPIVAVTGTNGKSSTTVMIGRMLEESGLRTAVGGNLGTALCALVGRDAERVVCELSSFQLEHAKRLRAHVAVLLNLAPDHLDRHGTLENYGRAKERLADLQQAEDALVANLDDPWARGVASRARARTIGFSARDLLDEGAFIDGEHLVLRRDGRVRLRVPLQELSHASRTPIDNALAAVAAADAAGASPDAMRAVLTHFEGLPHRAQLVCTRAGVRWINDSKATNPAAAASSVAACEPPLIWLAGGRNKGLDFAPLSDAARKARALVAYGEARDALGDALAALDLDVARVANLADAVHEAARRAQPGDTVLLAPACASFDEFRDFEARGEAFARLARALPDGPGHEPRTQGART